MRLSIKSIETAGVVASQSTTFVEGSAADILTVMEGLDTLEIEREQFEAQRQAIPVGDGITIRFDTIVRDFGGMVKPDSHAADSTAYAQGEIKDRHDQSGAVKFSSGMAGAGALDSVEHRLARLANPPSVDEPPLYFELVSFFHDVFGDKHGRPATFSESHDIAKMFMARWRNNSPISPALPGDDRHLERLARITAASRAKRKANPLGEAVADVRAQAAGREQDGFGGPRPTDTKRVDSDRVAC